MKFTSCKCNAIPTDTPGEYTSCGQNTRREFAPGHDAKLKGALIKCHVAGIQFNGQDPMAVAKARGWRHFLDAAKERATTKPARKKAAKTESNHQATRPTKVKVGRWEYPLVSIDSQSVNSAQVTYLDRQGNTKQASVKLTALYGKAA